MEEDCFGIAQFHGMHHSNVFVSSASQTVFGPPHFYVIGDSKEFCKSDIVVPLTRMQAEGKKC
jgi:hypothetical protein